ncbi:MAG: YitT family protein [Faecalimonas sp.]|nr:YitT family protein [Faecalimonas sp.]
MFATKSRFKTYLFILLGVSLTGFAISVFLVPNKIVNGGASGLATVIYYTLGLKPSLANILINGVLLLISLLCLGWKFVAKTLFGIGTLTACF